MNSNVCPACQNALRPLDGHLVCSTEMCALFGTRSLDCKIPLPPGIEIDLEKLNPSEPAERWIEYIPSKIGFGASNVCRCPIINLAIVHEEHCPEKNHEA